MTSVDYKKCPYCGEYIRKQAIKCKYCDTDLQATSKEGNYYIEKLIKMNKRIIILCFILVLLVVLVLFRWNVWWDLGRGRVYQQDRLTSLVHIRYEWSPGNYTTHYQNEFITYATTTILYTAMGIIIIALLYETKKR